MRYGYFDQENKEYVIIRPDTPSPWINYLGQEEYCAIISNKVKRIFRNAIYNIEVYNPKHVSNGVQSIEVDGKKIKGNVLPIFKDARQHKVKAVMG